MPEGSVERVPLDAGQGPIHPLARQTLMAALEAGWADPRRLHSEGRRAAHLLDSAREVLADGLGARPDELTFHPTGTHALLTGLRGIRRARERVGSALLTSAVDQAAVLREPDVDALPVDGLGRLDPAEVSTRLAEGAVGALALAEANLEIGTRQPMTALVESAREHDTPLLVDATASWGRLPLTPGAGAYAADAATVAGPPLGLLVTRTGTRLRRGPLSQPERGLEPAPPFVPILLAAAEAWQQHADEAERDAREATELIDRIRAAASAIPDVQVVGDPSERLPHVVTFSVLYVDGETMVHALDRQGFAVASGSACTSDIVEPSHVLAAIGAITHGNVRVTLPLRSVAPERVHQVERFCTVLPEVVAAVRTRLGTDHL